MTRLLSTVAVLALLAGGSAYAQTPNSAGASTTKGLGVAPPGSSLKQSDRAGVPFGEPANSGPPNGGEGSTAQGVGSVPPGTPLTDTGVPPKSPASTREGAASEGTASQGAVSGSSSAGSSAMTRHGASAASAQAVQQELQKAGFQDVQVVDAAYVLEATTPSGEPVLMTINPPAVAGSGSSVPSGAAGQAQQSAVMSPTEVRDALQKAGFTDVRTVDTAYTVQAKTASGGTVVMAINPPETGTGASGAAQGGQTTK